MVESANRCTLRQLIQDHFDLGEIRELCFELYIDYEELGEGLRKSTRVVELIKYVQQQGNLDSLLGLLRQKRPKVAWPTALVDTLLGLGPGKLISVPSLPPHFLQREDELSEVKTKVLFQPIKLTERSKAVGIQGMGGVGKSVLAAALARDDTVRDAFPDGIFWLVLGQTPHLDVRLRQLAHALGDDWKDNRDLQEGKTYLSKLLINRTCLVILDDVWQLTHIQAFDVMTDSESQLLITTRDRTLITSFGATEHRLEVLDKNQSMHLLADWSGKAVADLPKTAWEVANVSMQLPLTLALCGALVYSGVSWRDLYAALTKADLAFLDAYQIGERGVMASMEVSLNALPDEAARVYSFLGAIREAVVLPEAALIILWAYLSRFPVYRVRQQISLLEQKALLRIEGETGARIVSLHSLQHMFLRNKIQENITYVHSQWVAAYELQCGQEWANGPNDGYFYENIHYHIISAEQYEKLVGLICNAEFLVRASEAFRDKRYESLKYIEQYLHYCLKHIPSKLKNEKILRLASNLGAFANCLYLHVFWKAGCQDEKARCKHCNCHTIIHGRIDVGSLDCYDNYFSWCTNCYWAWHEEEWQMYGYEEPLLEFNYTTNTYTY